MNAVTEPVCYSCQRPISDGDCLKLSDFTWAICQTCWGKLSIGERLQIAILLEDRRQGGTEAALARLLEILAERLESPGGWSQFLERGEN